MRPGMEKVIKTPIPVYYFMPEWHHYRCQSEPGCGRADDFGGITKTLQCYIREAVWAQELKKMKYWFGYDWRGDRLFMWAWTNWLWKDTRDSSMTGNLPSLPNNPSFWATNKTYFDTSPRRKSGSFVEIHQLYCLDFIINPCTLLPFNTPANMAIRVYWKPTKVHSTLRFISI